MITKQMAVGMQQTFIDNLPARIDAAITANAQQGIGITTVSYAPAGNGVANALRNLYAANPANGGGGWNGSTVDTVAKTITIAP